MTDCCDKFINTCQEMHNTLAECLGNKVLDNADYNLIREHVEHVCQCFIISYIKYIQNKKS